MNVHTTLQDSLHDTLHDRKMCSALLDKLKKSIDEYKKPIRFMEVCGTHTVSIFQSGLRSLLPEGFTHLSGPGCPVCVFSNMHKPFGYARRLHESSCQHEARQCHERERGQVRKGFFNHYTNINVEQEEAGHCRNTECNHDRAADK